MIDGPTFEERITVCRCVGCENHITGDTVETSRGKVQCGLCGTTIQDGQLTDYVLESAYDNE